MNSRNISVFQDQKYGKLRSFLPLRLMFCVKLSFGGSKSKTNLPIFQYFKSYIGQFQPSIMAKTAQIKHSKPLKLSKQQFFNLFKQVNLISRKTWIPRNSEISTVCKAKISFFHTNLCNNIVSAIWRIPSNISQCPNCLFLNIFWTGWHQLQKYWHSSWINDYPSLSRSSTCNIGQSPCCFKL